MSRPDLPANEAYASESLLRKKSRKMLQDINQCYHKTTESRFANAHLTFNLESSGPSQALLKTAEIPNFRRRAMVTK